MLDSSWRLPLPVPSKTRSPPFGRGGIHQHVFEGARRRKAVVLVGVVEDAGVVAVRLDVQARGRADEVHDADHRDADRAVALEAVLGDGGVVSGR